MRARVPQDDCCLPSFPPSPPQAGFFLRGAPAPHQLLPRSNGDGHESHECHEGYEGSDEGYEQCEAEGQCIVVIVHLEMHVMYTELIQQQCNVYGS